jgi:hypothetical protein
MSLPAINPALEYTITENEKSHYDPQINKETKTFASAEAERDAARTVPKKCNKCQLILPLSYFSGNSSGGSCFFLKSGLRCRRGECISCGKEEGKGKAKAMAVAKKQGIPMKNAGAILAAGARGASAAAKKKNPNLKKVKGK